MNDDQNPSHYSMFLRIKIMDECIKKQTAMIANFGPLTENYYISYQALQNGYQNIETLVQRYLKPDNQLSQTAYCIIESSKICFTAHQYAVHSLKALPIKTIRQIPYFLS